MGRAAVLRVICALSTISATVGKDRYAFVEPRRATGAVSVEQARCMLRNRRVAFVGDSNTRFHYFQFNVFVETGLLRSGPYEKWGDRGPRDFDESSYNQVWTKWKERSEMATHRQKISKTFPDSLGLTTHFYFVQTTWLGKEDTSHTNMDDLAEELRGYDLIVYNSAWWDLKPWNEPNRGYVACGENWTPACASAYARDVDKVVERLLKPAKAAVWREASCCGDEPQWRFNVERMNDMARAAMQRANIGFVPTFYMYGFEGPVNGTANRVSLANGTIDGKHARPEFEHRWTVGVLQAAERQLRTGCLGRRLDGRGRGRPPD